MVMSLDEMLPILRCPRTGAALTRQADHLVSETGEHYPVVNGKPVLVKNVLPMHVTPPEESVISRNINEFVVGERYKDPGMVVLHLGSGDVPSHDKRVISMDILPTNNVDLIAEAEALPFHNGSVDRVVSGAVFEHVFDPIRSASEVRRVLKDGGTFYIDTAFMQAYHGFPSHYFNLTPQAVETFLVDDFILEGSQVPDSATVLESITALFDRFLNVLPREQRQELLDLPLREGLARLRKDKSRSNPYLSTVSEYSQRSMGASFVVAARKPAEYSVLSAKISEEIGVDAWAMLKREYYAARMAVIMRHHEVQLYRMYVTQDAKAQPRAHIAQEPRLPDALMAGRVEDPMNVDQWRKATSALYEREADLRELRDLWIAEYMSISTAAKVHALTNEAVDWVVANPSKHLHVKGEIRKMVTALRRVLKGA